MEVGVDVDVTNNKKEISSDLSRLSRKGTGSLRYVQPRLSLLGKPISYKMHRRDVRYRRLQARIYNFLERPKDWYAVFYHIGICAVCIGSLVLSTLSTIQEFEATMTTVVIFLEPLLLFWLIVEYLVRIWASGCRSRYQGWLGRMKFAQRPLCIVDAVIIISTVIVILVGSSSEAFAASTLRGLRFFQILRMVRMDRRAGTWKLLGSVVWAHRRELLTTVYIGFLMLLFSSYLVYLAEKDHNKLRFGTYADALWWGVVTLCTVGYGDVVPTTWAGKLIASFSAICGIAFFALPAGILGSGFALKVQQQQRQKHLIRRRVPAALLIQSLWRCYAADENSISIATWKPHMVPCPSPTQERPFKTNASFVSRFSTRRKGGPNSNNNGGTASPHYPLISRGDSKKQGCSDEDVPETLQSFVNRTWSHLSLATGLVDQRVDRIAMMKDPSIQSFHVKHEQSEEEMDLSPKIRELTIVDKAAIRSLRKIKYFVARKKFREALRPYDVKDVIEQYSAGHVDMLGRVKSLQCRLDLILGKSGSKNKDVYDSKVSLSSRIVKVERQVEDIESKLDLLIDLYKEDRKVLLQARASVTNSSASNEHANQNQQNCPKPRSILVDKQYTSEPSSPIIEKHPKKFMLRNHSDLSSRIRKRVTYRLHSAPVRHYGNVPNNEEGEESHHVNSEFDSLRDEGNADVNSVCSSRTVSNEDIVEDRDGETVECEAYTKKQYTQKQEMLKINNVNKEKSSVKGETNQNYLDYDAHNNDNNELEPNGSYCPHHNEEDCSENPDVNDVFENDSADECKIDIETTCLIKIDPPYSDTAREMNDSKDRRDLEHMVLLPLGSMQALAADSSDV
ncbi:potassium voltage-gated channel subfamily KQT member 4-like isoform X2 [Mya arenaria]|uniref:potassium voltage-gated channel subfamily KQT member 4-like isoform X2 n=1 Tax=Mya arenaria TaxID=6604 RepID=UPI0022DF86DD|nr:potassium voltage-gated channel subfamily KQT member 4-like isoform X2 [Mya arenaria]